MCIIIHFAASAVVGQVPVPVILQIHRHRQPGGSQLCNHPRPGTIGRQRRKQVRPVIEREARRCGIRAVAVKRRGLPIDPHARHRARHAARRRQRPAAQHIGQFIDLVACVGLRSTSGSPFRAIVVKAKLFRWNEHTIGKAVFLAEQYEPFRH